VDRCALFVDAGYVLTDGAMAAHGTSQREAVAWDYAGLLRYLAGLAVDRTGLALLRCYWYEATVDGRRTPEHDTLADLPGLTLRLGRSRPGKREGIDTEIHRDLTTLARNRAISDVVLVSAEDDLAQVIADVQDLGVRVIIVHISVDGNWTVSRALRQQCDDIVEIQGAQLRPFAESAGGEPPRYSEQYAASVYGGRPASNGHAASVIGGGHQALPLGTIGTHPAPPAIYTAPVVADYQQPQAPAAPPAPPAPPRREQPPEPAAPAVDGEPASRGPHEGPVAPGATPASASQPNQAIIGPPAQGQHGQSQHGQGQHGQAQQSQPQPAQQLYAAPPAPAPSPPAPAPASGPMAFREPPGGPEPPATQAQPGPPAAAPHDQRGPRSPYEGVTSTPGFVDQPGGQFAPAPPSAAPPSAPPSQPGSPVPAAGPDQFNGAPGSLPSRRGPQGPPGQPAPGQPGQPVPGQHSSPSAPGQPQGARGPQGPRQAPAATAGYVPQQVQYGAPAQTPAAPAPAAPASPAQPVQHAQPQAQPQARPQAEAAASAHGASSAQGASSADETVQAAHAEGFEFGESVARDAPALWLEAVLARKPRMPTDLEARLLQGSALPIDSLLHDEVRHALRRGFWDALERSRR